jgi:hypothetical protein
MGPGSMIDMDRIDEVLSGADALESPLATSLDDTRD